MVLDALIKIKNEIDPKLSFRRSCREGICGSCSMNIDGTNGFGVSQTLESETKQHDFASNSHAHLKRLDRGHDALLQPKQAHRAFPQDQDSQSSSPKSVLPEPRNRKVLDGLYECVLCASYSTFCPSYWWN